MHTLVVILHHDLRPNSSRAWILLRHVCASHLIARPTQSRSRNKQHGGAFCQVPIVARLSGSQDSQHQTDREIPACLHKWPAICFSRIAVLVLLFKHWCVSFLHPHGAYVTIHLSALYLSGEKEVLIAITHSRCERVFAFGLSPPTDAGLTPVHIHN